MFLGGLARLLANILLLHATTDALETDGIERRFVETPVGQMECWIVRTTPADPAISADASFDEPRRFVLHFIGNAARAETAHLIHRWNDVPTEVWAMNHPGFGRSEGLATLDRLAPAALGVYDHLAELAGNRPVFIDADSMGTTQALYVAAARQNNRPVAGLVLKNPPPLRELIMGQYGWWNLWLAARLVARQVPDELDSIANARRARCPAVFITATHDALVLPKYQREIIDAYAGPKRLVRFEDAAHNTPPDEPTEAQIRSAIAELMEPQISQMSTD